MTESEQMKQGGAPILHANAVFYRSITEVVGFGITELACDTTTGHHYNESVRSMITFSGGLVIVVNLSHGRAQ